MIAYLAFQVAHALQPVLFPFPKGFPRGSNIQTPVISFPYFVFAHRGGALEPGIVENTLPAFERAASLQVDLLELDVQATRDNKVVVFHDPTLARMAGPAYKGKAVRDFDYKDLPRLTHAPAPTTSTDNQPPVAGPPTDADTITGNHINGNDQPSAALPVAAHASINGQSPPMTPQDPVIHHSNGIGGQGADEATRIPLLSEVFTRFPGFPIQVDVKADAPGLVDLVHDQVMAHPNRRQQLLWGSFKHKVQRELYEKDPHIPLFGSAWRTIYFRLAHAAGRMQQVHIYESAVIVPWRIKALWGKAMHWYPFLDRSWCEALAARGVAVVFFGHDLNDTVAYRACIEAGASAVCTDRPALLQAFLADPSRFPDPSQGTHHHDAPATTNSASALHHNAPRPGGGTAATGAVMQTASVDATGRLSRRWPPLPCTSGAKGDS